MNILKIEKNINIFSFCYLVWSIIQLFWNIMCIADRPFCFLFFRSCCLKQLQLLWPRQMNQGGLIPPPPPPQFCTSLNLVYINWLKNVCLKAIKNKCIHYLNLIFVDVLSWGCLLFVRCRSSFEIVITAWTTWAGPWSISYPIVPTAQSVMWRCQKIW
jgi:hypothetical protein